METIIKNYQESEKRKYDWDYLDMEREYNSLKSKYNELESECLEKYSNSVIFNKKEYRLDDKTIELMNEKLHNFSYEQIKQFYNEAIIFYSKFSYFTKNNRYIFITLYVILLVLLGPVINVVDQKCNITP